MPAVLAQQANGEWALIDTNDASGAQIIRVSGLGPPPPEVFIVTISGLNITTLSGVPLRVLP